MIVTARLLMLGFLTVAALPAVAAVINVGPGGTTLPLALTAAGAAGDDEIRIADGEFVGNFAFAMAEAGQLTISGGWNPTFTMQTADPARTVLDGAASGHTFYVSGNVGRVEIHNLTLRNGRAFTGAGMEAFVTGAAQLLLADVVVRDNLATWEFASNGGGLKLVAQGDASVEVVDCVVRNNRAESTANSTLGGGAYFVGGGHSQMLVVGSVFDNNVADAPNSPQGGGFRIDASELATFELSRNVLRGNRLQGGAAAGGFGAAVSVSGADDAAVDLRAGRIVGNDDLSRESDRHQVHAVMENASTLKFGDSEVSAGNGGGALAHAFDTASAKLVNLTVADNSAGGVVLDRTASAITTIFSSILWGNGGVELASNLAPNSVTRNRIEGSGGATDPRFVDAAGGNYRLRGDSPAIDQGDATPDGGIGSIDADGVERRVGENVDQGAYEFGAYLVFADGFEG